MFKRIFLTALSVLFLQSVCFADYSVAQRNTIKYASISAASSGDNTLVAAVGGKKIRVLSAFIVAAGAVTAAFESGASGTALTGDASFAANGVLVLPYNQEGWFETAASALLNLELGGAVQTSGGLSYIEV